MMALSDLHLESLLWGGGLGTRLLLGVTLCMQYESLFVKE